MSNLKTLGRKVRAEERGRSEGDLCSAKELVTCLKSNGAMKGV